MQLTKDADNLVCHLYKVYLTKRKNGTDKLNAKHFSFSEIQVLKPCQKWSVPDIKAELLAFSLVQGYFASSALF